MKRSWRVAVVLLLPCMLLAVPVWGGAHTWDVNEIFSNADGSVWFIELREENGTAGEINLAGRPVTSTTNMFTIASNVVSPSSNRHLLLANQAFADLPGAPAPDQIVPIDNFFNVNGDTITYSPYDSLTFGLGQLPTDGVNSLTQTFATGANTPTNYAGQTGSVNASGGGGSLPGVPDGSGASTPMTASRLDVAGSQLEVNWDTSTCGTAADHRLIYGERMHLPMAPGGIFAVADAVCDIGVSGSFVWDPAPSATDGSGLIWWLVVTHDGAGTEGPWGKSDGTTEREGPGADGSSGVCAVTSKDLGSTCGH